MKQQGSKRDSSVLPHFTERSFKFLTELSENNNRDWFLPRKELYESEVKAPMEAVAQAVAVACQRKALPLFLKARSPVSRIYRDTRFSADKRPYQTHTGAALHGRSSGLPLGELYIHVSPERSFVAAGFYMPDPAFLRLMRARMADNPAGFEAVAKALRKKGLEFSTEWQLKRMPRGFERWAESAAAPYLRLNALVVSQVVDRATITSPAFVGAIRDFAFAARPLLEYGWALGFRPTLSRESDLA